MNDKAIEILNRLNEAADRSLYGRYITKREWADITREVMFGKPESHMEIGWGTKKVRSRHCGIVSRPCKVHYLVVEPMTKEQSEKLLKLFNRMIDKGIIKLSKSGNMITPMMTSAEWIKKNGKEVTT